MGNLNIELSNSYYKAETVGEKVVITNPFYDKKFITFLLYILLEYFDGPSFEFTQIPRKFIISGEMTYIRLSKKLQLETDGAFEIIFNKKDFKRWLLGAVVPMFLLLTLFLFLLSQTIGFLIISKLSLASIILFAVMLIMVALFSHLNLLLLKQYRGYKATVTQI